MQIRCQNCRMPITIGRQVASQALNIMQEDSLVHFDFRCPKCKKTNKVSQEQLLRAAPGWEYSAGEKKKEKEKPAGKEKEK